MVGGLLLVGELRDHAAPWSSGLAIVQHGPGVACSAAARRGRVFGVLLLGRTVRSGGCSICWPWRRSAPRSSNRMFPVRVFVTVCWLIFGVVAGIWSWVDTDRRAGDDLGRGERLLAQRGVGSSFWPSARAGRPRVRRHIPRRNPLRFLAWLFYTGSAGGVLWCSGLSVVNAGWSASCHVWSAHCVAWRRESWRWRLLVMLGSAAVRLVLQHERPVGAADDLPRSRRRWWARPSACCCWAIGGSLPLLLAYLIHGPNWQFDVAAGRLRDGQSLRAEHARGPISGRLLLSSASGRSWACSSTFLGSASSGRRSGVTSPSRSRRPASLAAEPPVVHV